MYHRDPEGTRIIGYRTVFKFAVIAAFAAVVAFASGTPREASALTTIYFGLDCNTAAAGIQGTCWAPPASVTIDVSLVIVNNSGSAVNIDAFQYEQIADQAKLDPSLPADANLNANPDFQISPAGTWGCGLPAPNRDSDPSPAVANSFLGCFDTGGGTSIANGGQLVLATVHYDIVVADAGTTAVTLQNVFASSGVTELGSCNPPVDVTADCLSATISSFATAQNPLNTGPYKLKADGLFCESTILACPTPFQGNSGGNPIAANYEWKDTTPLAFTSGTSAATAVVLGDHAANSYAYTQIAENPPSSGLLNLHVMYDYTPRTSAFGPTDCMIIEFEVTEGVYLGLMQVEICGSGAVLVTGLNNGVPFVDQPGSGLGIEGAAGLGKSPNRTGDSFFDAQLNTNHLLVEMKLPLTNTLNNSINPAGIYNSNASWWQVSCSVCSETAVYYTAPDPITGEMETAPLAPPPDMDLDTILEPLVELNGNRVSGDNCYVYQNVQQENADQNTTDLTPPKTFDDITYIKSDLMGDICDSDADNDGFANVTEEDAGACGGGALLPLVRDRDGDRALDKAECDIGTDPTNAAIGFRPTLAQCVALSGAADASIDTDVDGVKDYVEVCYYNSNPFDENSDRDKCIDGQEVGSVDGNKNLNASDLGQIAIAQLSGPYTTPPAPGDEWKMNMDVNKNGAVNAQDLGLAAATPYGFGDCEPYP